MPTPVVKVKKTEPLCPVFGECGGCQYQDIPYEDELKVKQNELVNLFKQNFEISPEAFDFILASPKHYHYRHRLDLKLLKTKKYGILVGFSPTGRYRVVPVNECPIALESVSEFIPELKRLAAEQLPQKYRVANLVVRTGDDGRVYWGGIGRRSLHQDEEQYLWTDIEGKKIYYSLETFFQANLSILPKVMERIRALDILNKQTILFDLYGGVGLFGLCLAEAVKKVVLVEENKAAVKLAQYNVTHNRAKNFEIIQGKVEDHLPELFETADEDHKVAFIDPPRKGLEAATRRSLSRNRQLQHIFYLSCHPESLIRDLQDFKQEGWQITKVCPFDFFPRTKHLETLVILSQNSMNKKRG